MDAKESQEQQREPAERPNTIEDLRAGLADQVANARQLDRAIARIQPLLVAVARRCLRDQGDPSYGAEDIAQDSWANALPRVREIVQQPDASTRGTLAYLCVTVRHLVLAALRHRTAERRVAPPEPIDPATGVVTRLARKERRSELLELLDSIDHKQREAWLLCVIEGRTDRQAASILGIQRDAVRQRVHRAWTFLRGRLQASVLDELA